MATTGLLSVNVPVLATGVALAAAGVADLVAVLVAVAWVALVGWTVVATVGNGVAGIWSDCSVYETLRLPS